MYRHIAVGGTFDGLHRGHRHFLAKAFEAGARVTIGLTSARYIQKYKPARGVGAYSRRYKKLTAWLRQKEYSARTLVMPIHDPFGPTLLPDDFDAIAVTRDTKHTAIEMNRQRLLRGLEPLTLVEIDLIEADDAQPISSTRVRAGEIDTSGRLMMPENLRAELQKPLGRVLTGQDIEDSIKKHRDQVIIGVGDVAVETLFSFGVQPALAIIDLRVNRKPYRSFEAYKFPKKYQVVRVASGPGYIAPLAVKAIQHWSGKVKQRKRMVIVVDGEEDLLALPAIVYAPIGSTVYYGQPQKGLVEVDVTQKMHTEIISILDIFTR